MKVEQSIDHSGVYPALFSFGKLSRSCFTSFTLTLFGFCLDIVLDGVTDVYQFQWSELFSFDYTVTTVISRFAGEAECEGLPYADFDRRPHDHRA